MIERSNAQWLEDLSASADGEVRDSALQDLRERLQRGIYFYLSRERSDLSGLATEEVMQMAQDFAQDATLRVLANLESFRGDSRFITWATKVAVRVAISELRRARYRDFSLDALTEEHDLKPENNAVMTSGPVERPESATEKQDVLVRINAALESSLSKRQRAAINAVILEGVPMEIVADQMGTNRNALYKLVHDARRKLRNALEEQGLSPDYIMNLFER